MNPDVIAATLRKALVRLKPASDAAYARRADLERQLAGVDRELDHLTGALAVGGNLQTLVQAIANVRRVPERRTRAAQVNWKTP